MPELPEVETIVRQLDKALRGKVIERVKVLRERSFLGEASELVGRKIKRVGRKSKMVIVYFKNWGKVLLVHLKMTGQLIYIDSCFRRNDEGGSRNDEGGSRNDEGGSRNDREEMRIVGGHPTADWVNKLPSKHTRVVINFKDGSRLFFNDMRVFGWMKIGCVPDLPPDVVDREFDFNYLKSVLSKSRRAIKLVLLNQKKIGGLGNIYVNDGLFLAKIDPKKPANDLSEKEIRRLLKAIVGVINKGIKMGGANYSDYKDTKGLGGKYQEHFLVYSKEGKKCEKCGGKIEKFKLGGRGTYWCEECQR